MRYIYPNSDGTWNRIICNPDSLPDIVGLIPDDGHPDPEIPLSPEAIEENRQALEDGYHAIIAHSVCSLQSQTAWLGAFMLGEPCNPTKIMACKAWASRAWAQYQIDKAAGLRIPTFNEPQPPYSFIETMTP